MIYRQRMGGWRQRELSMTVGGTEGLCWGMPKGEGLRGEGLRLYTGTYVLISRKGKKPMMSATTPCEPVRREVEVPNLIGHRDTPSCPGTPAHVLHEAHQGMSTLHNYGVATISRSTRQGQPVQMSLSFPGCNWKSLNTSSSAASTAWLWLWQPSQSLAPIAADK